MYDCDALIYDEAICQIGNCVCMYGVVMDRVALLEERLVDSQVCTVYCGCMHAIVCVWIKILLCMYGCMDEDASACVWMDVCMCTYV